MDTKLVTITADKGIDLIDQALGHINANRDTHQALTASLNAIRERLALINELEALIASFQKCDALNCHLGHYHKPDEELK